MTTLIQEAAAALLLAITLIACGAAVRFRRIGRARQRQIEQQQAQEHGAVLAEQQRARQLAEQQRALEDVLGYLAETGLAEAAAAALEPGEGRQVEFVLPQPLVGTSAAQHVEALVARHTALVRATRRDAREAAQQEVTRAHADARDATRAAVLTFSSSLVNLGAELADHVSVGVRRHISDEAYETLMEIDHTSQQMLRVAQGYMVLAGGTLGRRLPATVFTDIARAAMGRIQNFDRVRVQELDQAVVPRAVEALVHTLAILMDNAVRYAPPTSYAEVSFRTGHNGVTVVVDDAGLQMSPEQLERAREILSGKQPLDIHSLGAYPQTGFRVAAQLSQRYGFRIDLDAPNLFGGTRALVFVPTALLTDLPAQEPAGHLPTPAGNQPYTEAWRHGDTGQGPSPYPSASAHTGGSGHPGRPEPQQPAHAAAPVQAAGQPYVAPAPYDAGRAESTPPATTPSGLTRRRRRPTGLPTAAPVVAETRPGRPDIAAAWADGSRRGRSQPPEVTLGGGPGAGPAAAPSSAPGTARDEATDGAARSGSGAGFGAPSAEASADPSGAALGPVPGGEGERAEHRSDGRFGELPRRRRPEEREQGSSDHTSATSKGDS